MRFRIVSSQDIYREGRFDGSYHNAEAIVYDNIIKSHSSHNLNYYCTDIFTSGRNKRAYTSKEFGYPFLSNSDAASQNPFSSCKYNSKKYGYDESAVLKAGMILTGRVGAIGQTSFVPKYWEELNAMGSDNIIRIVVKPEYKNGYIYAYLASRIGNLQFWKHATGGVQPFITDVMVGELPIPDFPESFQQTVDDMVQESANTRELAADLLKEAITLLETEIGESQYDASYRTGAITSKQISSHFKRFDAQYQIGSTELSKDIRGSKTVKIGELAKSIFVGNRGKRHYVKEGLPFLSSSDMMLFNPLKYSTPISFKTPNIQGLLVHKDDILISRSGTIGNTVIVSEILDGKAVSEHALRLVIDADKISPQYVFCYLNTQHGKRTLESLAYGSVIITLGEEFVADIDLPIIATDKINRITELIKTYQEFIDKSTLLENNAVSMVESEIEKWNN